MVSDNVGIRSERIMLPKARADNERPQAMMCELCNVREATFHIQQVVNGDQKSIRLCAQCAKAKNFDASALETLSLVQELWKGLELEVENEAKVRLPDLSCPKCQLTSEVLQERGRLGCAQCYSTFIDFVQPFLRDVHVGVCHVGKQPGSGDNAKSIDVYATASTCARLETELEKAIAAEAYERAAELRDELRQIRNSESDTAAE